MLLLPGTHTEALYGRLQASEQREAVSFRVAGSGPWGLPGAGHEAQCEWRGRVIRTAGPPAPEVVRPPAAPPPAASCCARRNTAAPSAAPPPAGEHGGGSETLASSWRPGSRGGRGEVPRCSSAFRGAWSCGLALGRYRRRGPKAVMVGKARGLSRPSAPPAPARLRLAAAGPASSLGASPPAPPRHAPGAAVVSRGQTSSSRRTLRRAHEVTSRLGMLRRPHTEVRSSGLGLANHRAD